MGINKNQRTSSVRRLTLDALLVAVYFVLSMISVTIGGLKVTFEHLPVIICAVVYGPVDGLLVGAFGEFLNQMLTYGFTPTTILWMLPAMSQGFLLGLGAKLAKKRLGLDALLEKKIPVAFFTACAITGIISSCLNTAAFYVDSKMFGYYSYAMVFGVFWLRIFIGTVSSVLMAMVTKPVAAALRRTRFI